MQTSKQITKLLCLIGLLASGAALAQDTRAYVGFGAGQTRVSFDSTPVIAAGFPVTFDNSAGVWNVFGGYQFHKYFSAELTYYSLGDYNANVSTPGGSLFTDIKITGWGGALVGTYPLGKDFSLLGRIGETYLRETRGNCAVCAVPVTSSSANVWSPTIGVGLKYDFNPNWVARVEADYFSKVGSGNTDTFGGTVKLYQLGLAYKF
jgi:predicted porin